MNTIRLTEIKDVSTLGDNVVQAVRAYSPKHILRFDEAVLARVEVNKNRDEISAENLAELAATLPLQWIDSGHDTKKRQGFYIDARVQDLALLTSGIIWTDDDPEIPRKLATGELQFSMEATAESARCTVCSKTFEREEQYCDHLDPLENRGSFNANRQLFGMVATGGAMTPRPAGTDTRADPSKLQMIAHVVMASDLMPKPEEKPVTKPKSNARGRAVLAAQRFFEWANTPTLTVDGLPWHSPLVPPVISPLMYHAEPELVAAPMGQHPVTAEPPKIEEPKPPKVEAGARMGGLSWTVSRSSSNADSTVVWKK